MFDPVNTLRDCLDQAGIEPNETALAEFEQFLNDPIKSVSDVDPLFTEIDGRPVCTRTWENGSDPQLSHGEVVALGSAICRVTEKVTHSTKAGIYLITYQFSPSDT